MTYQEKYFNLLDKLALWGLDPDSERPSREFVAHWSNVYYAEDTAAAKRRQAYGAAPQLADPKRAAQTAVNAAVAVGLIPRITTRKCQTCGAPAKHYHHENYDREKWLEVIPLCRRCHFEKHTKKQEDQ